MNNKVLPLTVILLVKGREDFTERWLRYMSQIQFPHKVIIADGEDDGAVKNLLHQNNQGWPLDVKFYQFNTHGGFSQYFKMMQSAIAAAETKYVMLCDNDDFILPNSLIDIVNFLEKNQSYVSAGGKIVNFEIDNYNNVPYGKVVNFLKPYSYSRLDEPEEDFGLHIKSVFSNFQPNFYNIFRKETLETIANELVEIDFSDLIAMEFFIQLRAATLGKSRVLSNHSHYLRQRGTSQISTDYNFFENLLQNNLPDDIRRFSRKIADIKSEEKIYEIIRFEFAEYLNHLLANTVLKYRFNRLYQFKVFLKKLFDRLPRFLINTMSSVTQYKLKRKVFSELGIREQVSKIHNSLTNDIF